MMFNKDFTMISSWSLLRSSMALLLALLISIPAFSQDEEAAGTASNQAAAQTKGGQPKRTTIDFEDELVEGKTKNPELFYLLQKRQFNYKRLIRLRENFLPEMRKTSEDMASRKGSGE